MSQYRLGFLPDTTSLRIKQGLQTQVIASYCVDQSVQCNNKSLYPFPSSKLSYGKGFVPDNCSCAKNVVSFQNHKWEE